MQIALWTLEVVKDLRAYVLAVALTLETIAIYVMNILAMVENGVVADKVADTASLALMTKAGFAQVVCAVKCAMIFSGVKHVAIVKIVVT